MSWPQCPKHNCDKEFVGNRLHCPVCDREKIAALREQEREAFTRIRNEWPELLSDAYRRKP